MRIFCLALPERDVDIDLSLALYLPLYYSILGMSELLDLYY